MAHPWDREMTGITNDSSFYTLDAYDKESLSYASVAEKTFDLSGNKIVPFHNEFLQLKKRREEIQTEIEKRKKTRDEIQKCLDFENTLSFKVNGILKNTHLLFSQEKKEEELSKQSVASGGGFLEETFLQKQKERETLPPLPAKTNPPTQTLEETHRVYRRILEKDCQEFIQQLNKYIQKLESELGQITQTICEMIQLMRTTVLETMSEEEKANLPKPNICGICIENEVKYVFNPCGHTICDKCTVNPTPENVFTATPICHICRSRITSRIKLYFS